MEKIRKLIVLSLASYYLRSLQKEQWKESRLLQKTQLAKLRGVIKHAYSYVPYYHKLMVSLKLKPEDIKTHDDLKRIPPLDKEVIQQNHNEFITTNIRKGSLSPGAPSWRSRTRAYTSGSTGIPLEILRDYSFTRFGFYEALGQYPFFESGVKISDKFLLISARSQPVLWPNRRGDWLRRIPIISVPLFEDEEKLVKILQCIKPDVIWTFPQVMELIAMQSISGIAPRLFIAQGGMVHQNLRDMIKKKFNSEVFETYGSVEFSSIAFECEQHCGLHQITDATYLEFVDENGEHVAPGEEGEIVATGLYNYSMPLIRYRIGDIGIPSDEQCTCGRSLPLIKSIQGRINDIITLPSGRKITFAHLLSVMIDDLRSNVFCISQYQMIQEKTGELVLRVTKGSEFDPAVLNRIRNNLETYFKAANDEVHVSVEIVDRIPIDKSGKRRYIISKLN